MLDKVSFRRSLGAVLRQRREREGLTQDEFAERFDIHRTYIGAIERGERNISLNMLVDIALALSVTPSALCHEAEELLH